MAFFSSARLVLVAALCAFIAIGMSGCFMDSRTPAATVDHPPASSIPESKGTSTKPTAVVVIAGVDTDGAHVSVSGYVTGVIEDGGTCTFLVANKVTKVIVKIESTGVSDARTTSCGTNQAPIASFSRSSWTATLHYSSPTSSATSSPVDLEIP